MMRRFLLGAAALLAAISGVHSTLAGIVVTDAASNRRYENNSDGASSDVYFGLDSTFGQANEYNYVSSGFDSWYLVTQIPVLSSTSEPTISTTIHALDFSTQSGSTATWNINDGGYNFQVDMEFSFDSEGVLAVDGTLNYAAPGFGSFPTSPVRAQLFNLFQYTDPTQGDIEFASISTPSTNYFEFDTLRPDDEEAYRQATIGSSGTLNSQIGVMNAIDEDSAGGGDFVAASSVSGGFEWFFNFDGATGSSNTRSFGTFSAVPEPSSLLYATMFGMVAIARRRRRS